MTLQELYNQINAQGQGVITNGAGINIYDLQSLQDYLTNGTYQTGDANLGQYGTYWTGPGRISDLTALSGMVDTADQYGRYVGGLTDDGNGNYGWNSAFSSMDRPSWIDKNTGLIMAAITGGAGLYAAGAGAAGAGAAGQSANAFGEAGTLLSAEGGAGAAGAGAAGAGAGSAGLGTAAAAAASQGINWTDLVKQFGGDAIKAGLSLYNTSRTNDANKDLAQQFRDATAFKPYNITTGAGSAGVTRNPDGSINMNAQLSPELAQLQSTLQSNGSNILSGINANSVQQLAQQNWDKYNQLARPSQQSLFMGLQDRLAAQGLLGLQSNAPDVGMNGQAGNPFYTSFARGVADSDLANWQSMQTNAINNTTGLSNLGTSQINTALGLNKYPLDLLATGNNINKTAQSTDMAGLQQLFNTGSAVNQSNAALGNNMIDSASGVFGKIINKVL